MQKYIWVMFIIAAGVQGCGRNVEPFCVAINHESNPQAVVDHFDSLYAPAGTFMSQDSIPVAWYDDFRPKFEKHFADIGFQWSRETHIWVDLCCTPQGNVERVLYNSKTFANPETEKHFAQETERFLKNFTFRLRGNKSYSQCGTLIFNAEPTKSSPQGSRGTPHIRSLAQQQFASKFMAERDSAYVARHGKLKPFLSKPEIDSFMVQFEQAWKSAAGTTDTNWLRIESYTYGAIEHSKQSEAWAEEYVWKKYMLPSFLSDFAVCDAKPTADNASFLWPGNAGNIFEYGTRYDLPAKAWAQLSDAYAGIPALLQEYLSMKPPLDSVRIKSLMNTRNYLSTLGAFYKASDAIYADHLDEAFAILAAGLSGRPSQIATLSGAIKKLAFGYSNDEKRDRALAVLDLVLRSTTGADLSRDSLRAWYTVIDPRDGPDRFERISAESSSLSLSSSGKRVYLSGIYTNLVTGKPFDLAGVKGKTVLLDFWATWCGPCVQEIPALNEFARRYADRKDFVFLAICGDAIAGKGGESESEVEQFTKKKEMQYGVIYDKSDSSLARQFAVVGWPSKYLVDPKGEILQRSDGTTIMNLNAVEEYLAQTK